MIRLYTSPVDVTITVNTRSSDNGTNSICLILTWLTASAPSPHPRDG